MKPTLLLAVAFSVATTAAMATDWVPELLPPETGYRTPQAPVSFLLPALPTETLERLALEVDSFDVTAYVSSADGRHAVFTPPQPLTPGRHTLRLVEVLGSGQGVERGRWILEIRGEGGGRQASLSGDLTFSLSRRLADQGLTTTAPGPNRAEGALGINGSLTDSDWKLTGNAALLGNSRHDQLPHRDGPIDLATFLLTAEAGPVVAQIGHHAVGPDSLVMQGFNGRGLSVGMRSADGAAALTAFALNTGNVTGFRQGLGVGDADDRTMGVVASYTLTPGGDSRVWGTWVTGAGRDQTGQPGSGVSGETSQGKGHAAAIAGHAAWFDRRLQGRVELARSRFDADGPGTDTDGDGVLDQNEPYRDGDGQVVLLDWRPWDDLRLAGRPVALSLGLERRRLGTWLRSPAAPGAARDTDLWKGNLHMTWAGLNADLALSRASDNVDDQPDVARSRTQRSSLNLGWTPEYPAAPGGGPALPWYGQPYLGLALDLADLDVIRGTPALLTGPLRRTDSLTLSALFSGQSWSWGLTQVLGRDDDLRQSAPDQRLTNTQLFATLQLGDRLSLGPTLGRSVTSERDPPAGVTAKDRTTRSAGLNLSYAVSEGIHLNAGYALSDEQASDGSAERRTQDLNLSMSWTVAPPKAHSPGLSLWLDGSRHDESGPGADSWQIFLRAVIGLPLAL